MIKNPPMITEKNLPKLKRMRNLAQLIRVARLTRIMRLKGRVDKHLKRHSIIKKI